MLLVVVVVVVVVEDEDLVVQVVQLVVPVILVLQVVVNLEFQTIKFRNYWMLLNLSNQLVVKCGKGWLEIIKLVAAK